MLIVAPDFDRRIDLSGAGPCPRPVDIDRAKTGFTRLVSLRVYSFARDMVIDGEAEGDEVFIVLMHGRADIAVDQAGVRVATFALNAAGGARAVYLPPQAAYQLRAEDDCDVAYARVAPPGATLPAPRAFSPVAGRLAVPDYAAGMELLLAHVTAGERFDVTDSAGGLPERFAHLRAGAQAAATLAGERVGDWQSAIVGAGEAVALEVAEESIDILTIGARPR